MIAASLADNLLTAPVIAFLVALIATLLRFEIRLPESLYPILSTFLLLAIGIKGGRALAASSPSEIWKPLIAALLLGVITPVVAFALLRVAGRLDVINSAAIAAHYGSVSAVTFTVLIASLESREISYEGFAAGLLAVLEIVGIIVALFLARGATTGSSWKETLSNRYLWTSLAAVLILQVGVTHFGPMQRLFDTTSISLMQWLICVAVASSVLFTEELRKIWLHARSVPPAQH